MKEYSWFRWAIFSIFGCAVLVGFQEWLYVGRVPLVLFLIPCGLFLLVWTIMWLELRRQARRHPEWFDGE